MTGSISGRTGGFVDASSEKDALRTARLAVLASALRRCPFALPPGAQAAAEWKWRAAEQHFCFRAPNAYWTFRVGKQRDRFRLSADGTDGDWNLDWCGPVAILGATP